MIDIFADLNSIKQQPSQDQPVSQQRFVQDDHKIFERPTRITAMLKKVQLNSKEINELREQFENCSRKANEIQIERRVQQKVEQSNKLISSARQQIQDLKNNIKSEGQAEQRNEKNVVGMLLQSLRQSIITLKKSQENYKAAVKDKIKRQIKIIEPYLDQQSLQQYSDDPVKAHQFFEQKVLGKPSEGLKNTVSDLQEKHKDMLRLNKSIQDCLRLLRDVSELINTQGQMIDNIAANVSKAKDYVQRGQKHLGEAKEEHECYKKKMCWIILAAVLILVVVLAITIPLSTKG